MRSLKVSLLSMMIAGTILMQGCTHHNGYFTDYSLHPIVVTTLPPWMKHQLVTRIEDAGVTVVQQGHTLRLVLPTDQFFIADTTDINPDFVPVLGDIAILLAYYPYQTVIVSGHTDNVNTRQYKLDRSDRLAHIIAAYLWSHGVSIKRMRVIGYGDYKQNATDRGVDGSGFNRRVEIRVIYN